MTAHSIPPPARDPLFAVLEIFLWGPWLAWEGFMGRCGGRKNWRGRAIIGLVWLALLVLSSPWSGLPYSTEPRFVFAWVVCATFYPVAGWILLKRRGL